MFVKLASIRQKKGLLKVTTATIKDPETCNAVIKRKFCTDLRESH